MRLLTLNLWGERGAARERLRRLEQELASLAPDVVAFQEVRNLPNFPDPAQALAHSLGYRCFSAPAMEWGGGTEGVALLSRGGLEDIVVRELPHASNKLRRVALSARVEVEDELARVVTTHLHYRLEHGQEREDQVKALASLLDEAPEESKVLLGDLNATPDSDEIRFLAGKCGLGGRRVFFQDAWQLHHPTELGHTWARENPYTNDLAWLRPGRRIDYIFVSAETPEGRNRVTDCRIVFDVPSPSGLWVSDHYGLWAEVQTR